MDSSKYIVDSLELHLFFGRIMKEHSFFLKAGFTSANPEFSRQAELYKLEFEKILSRVVRLSDGIVRKKVLDSGEVVTEFTLEAERQTVRLTGINLDKEITRCELALRPYNGMGIDCVRMRQQVHRINQMTLRLLDGLIDFKENILNNVLGCKMFTMNYPLLIEHILREAKLYRRYIEMLEREGELSEESVRDVECFWNQIMMEHAMFIRGLLDPTEEELFRTADEFSKDYSELLERCRCAQNRTMNMNSLEQTLKFRDFKMAGTKGIQECQIRSIILPLLADHVLREANHYIRLLNE